MTLYGYGCWGIYPAYLAMPDCTIDFQVWLSGKWIIVAYLIHTKIRGVTSIGHALFAFIPSAYQTEIVFDLCTKYEILLTFSVNSKTLLLSLRAVEQNSPNLNNIYEGVILSGRTKKYESFWFTFFHEVGHILLHGKKNIFLEDLEYEGLQVDKEKQADSFANRMLLSLTDEREILRRSDHTPEAIQRYALTYGSHPSIRAPVPHNQARKVKEGMTPRVIPF